MRELIDDRGGYRVVATAISTPEDVVAATTVHSWCRTNRIPPYRRQSVLALPSAERPDRRRKAA